MDYNKFQKILDNEINNELLYLSNNGKIKSYYYSFEKGLYHYSIGYDSIFNKDRKSDIYYHINYSSNELRLEWCDSYDKPKYNINNIKTFDEVNNIAKIIINKALKDISIQNYTDFSMGVRSFLRAMPKFPSLFNNIDNKTIPSTNKDLYDIKLCLDNYLESINYINPPEENTIKSNEENACSKLNNCININEIINQENASCPNWVQQNIKLGSFGESVAQKYLKKYYKDVDRVSLKSDSFGYDIIAYNNVFEVKTSTNDLIAFHITNKQLMVAKDIPNKYNLFYIHVDKEQAISNGFIIKNPIEMLDLHNYNATNISNSCGVSAFSDGLTISLEKDFVERNFEIINLNDCLLTTE